MDENALGVLMLLLLSYLAVTLTQASIRLLWFDEFITFYIAKLNSFHAIWNALDRGADPNPPLTHLAAMWSMHWFGENAIAFRLPSIVAGLLGITCLFLLLKRKLPVLYAAIGTLFFMGTAGMDYSYEGRSYALMLAFCISSFLCWRLAVESKHKYVAAAFTALALALGLSSNYFAVLAWFPIAGGELTYTLRTRKIRWHVVAAMVIGALPLLLYWPLIHHSIAVFSPFAWNKPHLMVIWNSYEQMAAVNLILACALIVSVAIVAYYDRRLLVRARTLSPEEITAVVLLILYPVLGYVVAKLRAGMISPRFVLPLCYGLAIASAVLGFKLFGRRAKLGVALLITCAVLFLAREGVIGYWFYQQRLAVLRVCERLPAGDTAVVSDSLLVLPLHYYARPEVASRIVFPIDFEAIRRYKGEDSPEQNLWAGRDLFPVPIVPLQDFRQGSSNYLIVTTRQNWLVQKLARDGEPPEELAIPTDTQAIGGFFPLSHGEVYFFQEGDLPEQADAHTVVPPQHPTSHDSSAVKR